jgi:outer membrane lipoprotein-sorting protein
MTARLFLSVTVASAVVSACLFGISALAAPTGTAVNFTPPLAAARTIQVTEIVWEAQNGPTPGPLQKGGTMNFRIERPDKFRVEMKASRPGQPVSYDISDGKTMVGYDGKRVRSQPTARAEWPFPMVGLLNNSPGPVSAVSAVRDGKPILLAVRASSSGREEFWFDPKTHLLIRSMMFLTWQGKTTEVMRTDYTNWILNKPLSSAVFRVPSPGENTKSSHERKKP